MLFFAWCFFDVFFRFEVADDYKKTGPQRNLSVVFSTFEKNGGFIKLRMDQWWLGVKQTMAAISRQFNVIW